MLSKCEGHSSYITHIDWSADSRVLMSNCGAYDLLFFEPHSGRKLKRAQNDTLWDTWTCTPATSRCRAALTTRCWLHRVG